MDARSNEVKVEIVLLFGQANRNYHETVRLFNETHPERPVSRCYVRKLIHKFMTTFSVKDAPRPGRPKVRDETKELDVLLDYTENPQQSVRFVAEKHSIAVGTTHKILKENKFHPYKIQLVHELNEDDPDRRLQFCDAISHEIDRDPLFVFKTCFSDECTFFLNGLVNRHNCRYWCKENPHVFRESHTQFPEKINVWCGILGNSIVGPFFLEENLTGELYLNLLENAIVPRISEIAISHDFDPIFQQDGAPPHYARRVRDFLDAEFSMWIGRRGTIEWPPRSPDFSPLDFFLWGHLKSVVFMTQPANIEELKQRINEECRNITPQMLQNVRENFMNRLPRCQEMNGGQFEHLV